MAVAADVGAAAAKGLGGDVSRVTRRRELGLGEGLRVAGWAVLGLGDGAAESAGVGGGVLLLGVECAATGTVRETDGAGAAAGAAAAADAGDASGEGTRLGFGDSCWAAMWGAEELFSSGGTRRDVDGAGRLTEAGLAARGVSKGQR